MEEEDDDLYGTNGAASLNAHASTAHPGATNGEHNIKEETMEELEEGEEEEEEGSESDIDIITERKDLAPEPTPQPTRLNAPKTERKASIEPAPKPRQASIPIKTESPARNASQRPGSSYPEVRTSTIDVNANPIWEPVGKPITEVDIDADLAEHDKPWRRPGADPSDYFNYGFDEFTWTTYTLKQKTMADTLAAQKAETAKFELLFGGGAPSGPSMPAPAALAQPAFSTSHPPAGPANAGAAMGGLMAAAMGAGMPGMPGSDEMMQTMMQQMMAQGINDPTQLDFGAFMQGMQQMQGPGQGPGMGGPGQGVPQGPAAQQWGGGYGRGGAGGGRGRRW